MVARWKKNTFWRIIFFEEDQKKHGGPFILDLQTSRLFELLENYPEIVYLPKHASWSQDGAKITFSKYVEGESLEIFTINADGTNLQRITNNTWKDIQPCFSPDGSKICFISYRHPDVDFFSGAELFVINIDGTEEARLTAPQMLEGKHYPFDAWATDRDPDWVE